MATFLGTVRSGAHRWMILAAMQAVGAGGIAAAQTTALSAAAPIPAPAANCQADGWDMSRELQAFARAPESTAAGRSAAHLPVLHAGVLYALRLQGQADIEFVQPLARPGKAVTPMAGMTRFTVPAAGRYRITLDSPLWIDMVTPKGVIAPAAYTGWHECSVFRKSVDYILEAGQDITVQFSDSATDLVKLTIEPPLR